MALFMSPRKVDSLPHDAGKPSEPGHHFGKEAAADNDHSFRPGGVMNEFEFKHHFTNRLHENTSLSLDKIHRAHAIGEGFMDSDRSGFFSKKGMDSNEGREYLKALHEGGFDHHEVKQIEEAMAKDF